MDNQTSIDPTTDTGADPHADPHADTVTELEDADMAGLIDGADPAAEAGVNAVPQLIPVASVMTLARARELPELPEGEGFETPEFAHGSVERFIDSDGSTKQIVMGDDLTLFKTPVPDVG